MVTSSSVIWSYSTNLTEIDVDDHRDNIEDMYIYIYIYMYHYISNNDDISTQNSRFWGSCSSKTGDWNQHKSGDDP